MAINVLQVILIVVWVEPLRLWTQCRRCRFPVWSVTGTNPPTDGVATRFPQITSLSGCLTAISAY